jgi:hypothetical protein
MERTVNTEVQVSPTIHHPRATLIDTNSGLSEILACALLDCLTGRLEGASEYEEMAKRHPDYTPQIFWGYLAAVAKRQLLFREDPHAAIVTLNRGLEPELRSTPEGTAAIHKALAPVLAQMPTHEAVALISLLG